MSQSKVKQYKRVILKTTRKNQKQIIKEFINIIQGYSLKDRLKVGYRIIRKKL